MVEEEITPRTICRDDDEKETEDGTLFPMDDSDDSDDDDDDGGHSRKRSNVRRILATQHHHRAAACGCHEECFVEYVLMESRKVRRPLRERRPEHFYQDFLEKN